MGKRLKIDTTQFVAAFPRDKMARKSMTSWRVGLHVERAIKHFGWKHPESVTKDWRNGHYERYFLGLRILTTRKLWPNQVALMAGDDVLEVFTIPYAD